jgi:hypothetical protein
MNNVGGTFPPVALSARDVLQRLRNSSLRPAALIGCWKLVKNKLPSSHAQCSQHQELHSSDPAMAAVD